MALLVWLPLINDLTNNGTSTATFSYVNNNGKLVINNDGKIGKCYERILKASADLFRSSINFNLTDDITMCCWAYVTDTVGDTANGIITNHNHATSTGIGITVKQVSTTDYRISCNTGTGSSRTYCSYYGTTNIKDSWHHLAITYSKSAKQLLLYVDAKVEYTLNNYSNGSAANPFDIFNWSTGHLTTEYRAVCKLNDVRLYDECLSVKRLKEISKGLVVHYPFDDISVESTTNLVSSLVSGGQTSLSADGLSIITTGTNSDTYFRMNLREALVENTVYTLSFDCFGSKGTLYDYRFDNNASFLLQVHEGHNIYTFTANSALAGKTQVLFDDGGRPAVMSSLIFRHLQLEKKNHGTEYINGTRTSTKVYDTSGYRYNGTITGSLSINSDTKRYSYSTYIPTAGYVSHPLSLTNVAKNQEWTCCAWVKLTSTTGNQQLNNFNLGNRIVHSTTPLLYLNGGDNDYYEYGSIALAANTWTHIAFVFKNSTGLKQVYINGVLRNAGGPNKTSTPSGIPSTISVGCGNFDGFISDYREYSTALSADDILELYQSGISLDNKGSTLALEFDEMSY